jgi:sarcosine oxidase / L-pipecolate oxidase
MPQVLTSGGADVAFFRCCWDAITPQQHQLITRHPSQNLPNVFFAIGGSFHGWKFLPTIGKYVVKVIHGESNGKEMDETWGWKAEGWNTSAIGGAHEHLVPKREFVSFLT